MRKLLIVGNVFDKHILRFLKALRKTNADMQIDIFDISTVKDSLPKDAIFFSNVYLIKRYFPKYFYNIVLLSSLCKYWDMKIVFRHVTTTHYDVLNVQFLNKYSIFLKREFEKTADRVIFTPWGSDIYRQKKGVLAKLSKAVQGHDVCIMPKSRFGEDCKAILKVNDDKCIPLCIGSDVLDDLNRLPISKAEAQEKLFNKTCFTIVCGYNAAEEQNHLAAIKALRDNRNLLPKNSLVVLPMTYSRREAYVNEVKTALKESDLNYLILENYLDSYDIICLRKATDLFIHIQTSDAYSSSLQEALLCKSDVINGAWLPYYELEQFGIPYLTVQSIDELSSVLQRYFKRELKPVIPAELMDVIMDYSWSKQAKKWVRYIMK